MPEPQNDDVDLKLFLIDITTDIVEELVDDRTKIQVSSKTTDNSILISISAANGEMGKIIGKNGQTICALRHLLRAMAYKEKLRVTVETVGEGKPK